jgi:hypothetical protein
MMGPARDCVTRTPAVYPGSGPSTLEVTPLLPALFLILSTLWLQGSSSCFGLEEEEEGSDLPSLRVQAPLYKWGPGYRLGIRLPGCRLLRGHGLSMGPSSQTPLSNNGNFIKCLSPYDQHLRGICPMLCLRSFHGESSCPLIGGGRAWLASRLSPASVDLVGARLLLAKQPLEEFHHLL